MRRPLRFSLFACALGAGAAAVVCSRGLDRDTPSRHPKELHIIGSTDDATSMHPSAAAIATATLVAKLREAMRAARTPENICRVAVAELAPGRPRISRDLLVEASARQPESVAILADLSVAELLLGHFAEAAEICGRALELDRQLPAAAFNRALALEQLRTPPPAIAARESSPLFAQFHSRLSEGARPVDALREAQRSLLLHSSDPSGRRSTVWGGVTLSDAL